METSVVDGRPLVRLSVCCTILAHQMSRRSSSIPVSYDSLGVINCNFQANHTNLCLAENSSSKKIELYARTEVGYFNPLYCYLCVIDIDNHVASRR